MKQTLRTIAIILAIIPALARTSLAAKNSCVECHENVGGDLAKPITDMKGDVHDSHGFSCVDCHGGDATNDDQKAAMDPAKGWVGKPVGVGRVEMCGKCHSNPDVVKKFSPSLRVDQEELYWTSIHGQKLKTGDEKPATCANCHGHHGIYKPDDQRSKVFPSNVPATCGSCHGNADYMKSYNIPTNQYEEYKQSVHGVNLLKNGDTSSPACNDCHGNHGAVPPGIKNISYVCSQCHPIQQELFQGSPHGAALEATGQPSCSDCHGKHKILKPSDSLVGVDAGSICVSCHSDGDPGFLAAKLIKGQIVTLKEKIQTTKARMDEAESHGMPTVDQDFAINQAESALVKSRTIIHSFTLSTVEAVTGDASKKVDKASKDIDKFFGDLKFRKLGLWVTWAFIVIFSLAMYLKIKDLEAAKRKNNC